MNLNQPRDSAFDWIFRHKSTKVSIFALAIFYSIANNLPDPPMLLGSLSMRLREILCSFIFCRTGKDVKIHNNVYFGSGNNLCIGNHSNISHGSWISSDTVIGNDVMMGPFVFIISATHANKKIDIPMRLQGMEESRPVIIGDDVWIGSHAILLPGVKISSHTIVAAGSVVTKSFPAYSVIGGNPARLIKMRSES